MNTQVQPEQIQQQQSQQPVQSKQPKRQRRQRKKNKNTITAAADKQPEITAEARLRLHTKRYADQIIMNNYDSPIDSDGQRFLLTVFAPKNVDKQSLRLAGWLKDLAPSHELHRAFYPKNPKVEPISGEQFIARYSKEIQNNSNALKVIEDLRAKILSGINMTLLCSCKAGQPCHRFAVREMILDRNYFTKSEVL